MIIKYIYDGLRYIFSSITKLLLKSIHLLIKSNVRRHMLEGLLDILILLKSALKCNNNFTALSPK